MCVPVDGYSLVHSVGIAEDLLLQLDEHEAKVRSAQFAMLEMLTVFIQALHSIKAHHR